MRTTRRVSAGNDMFLAEFDIFSPFRWCIMTPKKKKSKFPAVFSREKSSGGEYPPRFRGRGLALTPRVCYIVDGTAPESGPYRNITAGAAI